MAALTPSYQVVGLWVKQMKNGQLVKAWDMLNQVGSPNTGVCPEIPEWTSDQGDFNFQIEVTAKNLGTVARPVKFRTQTCPKGTGGIPPMPIPPCGGLVDSGTVTIAPGETKLLPIWQLRMWSVNIDQHCEIVDENGYVYNSWVMYYDNAGYQADDFYIPINVTAAPPPSEAKGKIVQGPYAPSQAKAGDSVAIEVGIQNVGGTAATFGIELIDRDTGVVIDRGGAYLGPNGTKTQDFTEVMPNKNWNLRVDVLH